MTEEEQKTLNDKRQAAEDKLKAEREGRICQTDGLAVVIADAEEERDAAYRERGALRAALAQNEELAWRWFLLHEAVKARRIEADARAEKAEAVAAKYKAALERIARDKPFIMDGGDGENGVWPTCSLCGMSRDESNRDESGHFPECLLYIAREALAPSPQSPSGPGSADGGEA